MATDPARTELIVLSRPGCHLCEVLIEKLLPLVRDRLEVQVRDVDRHERWRTAYGNDVPVLLYGEREICRHELDPVAVNALLAGLPPVRSLVTRTR